MRKLNQSGDFHPLAIALAIAVLALIGTATTTLMYYSKFTEQRDKNQPLIESAVQKAKTEQQQALEKDFSEREKIPTKSYTSPAQLGSVRLSYPKTWSSYVDEKASGMEYYAHPNFVPAAGVNYALRMNVVDRQFATELQQYEAKVKKGELTSSAVQASGVNGTRFDGLLAKDQNGSMVVFPLRDKTLRVWTETTDFKGDFDNIVIKNLTFSP